MKRILFLFGTRPEAIKICPLIKEMQKDGRFDARVCVSGQHRDMLQPVMDFFGISADYNFDIMREKQTLSYVTSAILCETDRLLSDEPFDMAVVHGDTSTAFAASLAAFYHQVDVAHVEAGLRTHDIYSPYPEEFNRQAVGIVAKLHFPPTRKAAENLIREGRPAESVFVTGNTVIDAMRYTVREDYRSPHLDWALGSRLILLTAHRRENWGEPLENIFQAVLEILEKRPDIKVIYPVHPNPVVRGCAEKYLARHDRVRLIEPLDVFDFHNFMARSYLILSDSGGVQEEAPALDKPVLVLREVTERPEGVEAGTLKLIGVKAGRIVAETLALLDDSVAYRRMCEAKNPYGDGRACERIVRHIGDYVKGAE